MPTAYHRIASSLERLAALSDGIFAVVMTLLVLDLHVPVREGLHSEVALWQGLGRLAPQMLTYVLSLLTLGIFQVGQQPTPTSSLGHRAPDPPPGPLLTVAVG